MKQCASNCACQCHNRPEALSEYAVLDRFGNLVPGTTGLNQWHCWRHLYERGKIPFTGVKPTVVSDSQIRNKAEAAGYRIALVETSVYREKEQSAAPKAPTVLRGYYAIQAPDGRIVKHTLDTIPAHAFASLLALRDINEADEARALGYKVVPVAVVAESEL